jgi:flagellar biosynthesis protein
MSAEPGRPERAVALRYAKGGERAPEVVARGRGELARRILELADRHGVPVRRDADLLELLAACELGDEIPLELYAVVAELLAWLYRTNASR